MRDLDPLDDWPAPDRCDEDLDDLSMLEINKWRLQSVLAVHTFGIPSLQFGERFEQMTGRKFNLNEFGYDSLSDMVNKMPEIFSVQEPDECTAALFPDFPSDKILHDARLELNFEKLSLYDGEISPFGSTTRLQASRGKSDFEDLITKAWINRDADFPADVALIGESYEQLLKVSTASVPGTMGLYEAIISNVASPETIFIELKSSPDDQKRVRGLSNEIKKYFENSQSSIDAYNVPKEFLLPGFPCLVYSTKEQIWERCVVVGRSDINNVIVESVDLGGTYSVDQLFLYLIPRKFLIIPRHTLQVSLIGLKPSRQSERWSHRVGPRLRCWSRNRYYVEVLLMEQRRRKYDVELSPPSSPLASSEKETWRAKLRGQSKLAYEALIIDRNLPGMDLYLDEVLAMETYADYDESRIEEVSKIKRSLREALEKMPTPKSPLVP